MLAKQWCVQEDPSDLPNDLCALSLAWIVIFCGVFGSALYFFNVFLDLEWVYCFSFSFFNSFNIMTMGLRFWCGVRNLGQKNQQMEDYCETEL